MAAKKRKGKTLCKKRGIGFTNTLAVFLILFLAAGLLGGFVLAWRSIGHQYMGALACYTVVFTPMGTAISIVLNSIVRKSERENTGAGGVGIKFAAAQADGFGVDSSVNSESPMI